MKWILYVMLFSSAAANVKQADQDCLKQTDIKDIRKVLLCRSTYEKQRLWALQTNSQTEFSLLESCVRTQDKLIVSTNIASTMALRTWCICESDGGAKCPTDLDAYKKASEIRDCEVAGKTDCDLADKTVQGFVEENGQHSTSLQLYPLTKEEKELIFQKQPELRAKYAK